MAGAPKGNKNAASEKYWRDAIRVAVNRRMNGDPTAPKMLQLIAERLVIMAMQGDLGAIMEIGNRLDGRPTVDVVATVKKDIHEFTDAELAVIADAAATAVGGKDDTSGSGTGEEGPASVH